MVSQASDNGGNRPSRRFFLQLVAAFGLLLAVPRWLWAYFVRFFPVRTVEKDDFRFEPETGLIRWQGRKESIYALRVDGLVENPLVLSYRDLLALPQVEQVSDFHCVEGWSVKDIRWGGFRFDEIVKQARPRPGARSVIFHAFGETASRPKGQGHYLESHPLEKLLDAGQECLLALRIDGKPLPKEHGAPLRLVSPYDLGYKNIKYIARIEFAPKPRPGWWTLANPIYPSKAPVPESRLRKKR